MPDKEIKKSINNTPTSVTEETTTVVADTPRENQSTSEQVERKRRGGLILGLAGIIVVVIALLVAAAILIFSDNGNSGRFTDSGTNFGDRGMRLEQRSNYGYGTASQTQVGNGSVTTTVYTYLTGVVVAVNGDNIVIAGNGKQTTFQTNSSTTYDNNTKPAVNDTVTIAGTTSGTTSTATEIAVNN